MSTNPYTFEPTDTTDAGLYSLRGVGVASFFGSMIAGGIVIGISLLRLGKPRNAWLVICGSVVVFTILMLCIYHIPAVENLPSTVVTVPQVFLMIGIARITYGEELRKREQTGEPIASAWRAFGIGIITLLPVVGAAFGGAMIAEGVTLSALLDDYGTEITFGDNSIYINADATRDDAKKLATHFEANGTFDDTGIDVKLTKNGDHTEVSFITVAEFMNDAEIIEGFQIIADDLLAEGHGETVVVQLCDDYFNPQVTLTAQPLDPEADEF